MAEQPDYLEHYGVPGMKWGKRKAAAIKANNQSIHDSRARQSLRKSEISSLTAQRISATSSKGKSQLDKKLADKHFELKNNPDFMNASRLTSGEKVMKGVKIAGILGLSVVGAGAAANIISSEISINNNRGMGARLTEEYANSHANVRVIDGATSITEKTGIRLK